MADDHRIDLAALRAIDAATDWWVEGDNSDLGVANVITTTIKAVLAAAEDGLVCGWHSESMLPCGSENPEAFIHWTEHDFLPALVLPVIPEEANDE